MNRAQRRQLGRTQNEPMLTLKKSDVRTAVDETVKERIKQIQLEAVEQTLGIVCLSLNAEFGFGEKRLIKLIDRVQTQYECLQQGYITFQDVKNQVKEIGITLKAQ